MNVRLKRGHIQIPHRWGKSHLSLCPHWLLMALKYGGTISLLSFTSPPKDQCEKYHNKHMGLNKLWFFLSFFWVVSALSKSRYPNLNKNFSSCHFIYSRDLGTTINFILFYFFCKLMNICIWVLKVYLKVRWLLAPSIPMI